MSWLIVIKSINVSTIEVFVNTIEVD